MACALAVAANGCGGSRPNAPAPVAAGARPDQPCLIEAADSVLIRGAPLYPACGVDRPAQQLDARGTRIDYRPLSDNGCVSATIRFVVDTDGYAEDGARVVATNEPGFARAMIRSLGSWRYRPAELGSRKVRQLVTETRAIQSFTQTIRVPAGGGIPSSSSLPPPPRGPGC